MGSSWERLAELEAERQEVIVELAREVADMSPETREGCCWTHELEAAGVAPAEAEQYVQRLQQLGLDARAHEAQVEQEREAEREGVVAGCEEVELEEVEHVDRGQVYRAAELEHEGPELSR
jgi:hypothetical protein